MSANQQLLTKADWAIGDLTANSGLLNPEQANAFIRKLLIQPTLLAQARRVVMNAPTRKINKIQFASRILKAGYTAGLSRTLDDTANRERSKVTTEQIELNTKEVIAEVRLPYEVIEDNLERGNIGLSRDGGGASSGGIVSTIMDLIAERAALDLEELALLGDTGSADPFLALTDGYLARFTSNIVDAGGANISRTIMKNGSKTMPTQYRRNRSQMAHYLSTEQEIEYRDTLANRETSFGDGQHQSTSTVWAAGTPVEGVGLMPGAQGLLTHPLNLIFGVQRQIHIESDKDIQAREYIIVLTARVDMQVEEELAGVKYTNLGV
jgi:hypothetical protein